MATYLDGFLLPVPRRHLAAYQQVAEQVAAIWKEYGALDYREFVGDDLTLEGTRSFVDAVDLKEDEVVVFGWVLFPSQEVRESANRQVPNDPRMAALVAPLTDPANLIFDASRMVYGGFLPLVPSNGDKAG
ncbi:MAG: DUF1428 domain-containing protein [Bacteroidota bacterium]